MNALLASRTRRAFVATGGLLLAATLAGCAPAALAQAAPKRHRIVLQVSDGDPAKWNLALNNAGNVLTDLGAANVDVEIVAYGPGIGMLKAASPVGGRVGTAITAGVRVVACQNTMHAQKLTPADMLPQIGYVPAGVTELMKKQEEGWAYVRP